MSHSLLLRYAPNDIIGTTHLPSSKSIANRLLIIQALSGASLLSERVASQARDTRILRNLLLENPSVYDAQDAGTTARFLMAYLSLQPGEQILRGTQRLCERPMAGLIEAIRQLGGSINCLQKEGFLPVRIGQAQQWKQQVHLSDPKSSQFVSALLLVAPYLPKGLLLEVDRMSGSQPYVDMTVELMKKCGVNISQTNGSYLIPSRAYRIPAALSVEKDWSAAAYFYALAALSDTADLFLPGLNMESLQGDSILIDIFRHWGIFSQQEADGLRLVKSVPFHPASFSYDFSACPDLAQPLIMTCALSGIHADISGLHSLKYKETDRLQALSECLQQIGCQLTLVDAATSRYKLSGHLQWPSSGLTFDSYEDHRMAMSLSLCAFYAPTRIKQAEVVAKSFPGYWDALSGLGFELS